MSFQDPGFSPPPDIEGEDARAYEEKIVELLRDAATDANAEDHFLQPGRIHTIELRGERPDTEIILRFTGPGNFEGFRRNAARSRSGAVVFRVWRSGYPTSDIRYVTALTSAREMASAIWGDWCADKLEPLDPG